MKRILVALLVVGVAATVRAWYVKYGRALLHDDFSNFSEVELITVMMARPNSGLAQLASKELIKRMDKANEELNKRSGKDVKEWTLADFDSQMVGDHLDD